MKILLTGAGGFVGKRILERLLERGQTDVRCMLRDTSKGTALQAIAAVHPAAQVELIAANLKNPSDIAAALDGVPWRNLTAEAVCRHLLNALDSHVMNELLFNIEMEWLLDRHS